MRRPSIHGRTGLFYILLIMAALLIGNCKKDIGGEGGKNTPVADPLKATSKITTTVRGMVVDESGSPLSGVEVTVDNETSTTSSLGYFAFKNIEVPGNRCVVVTEKEGYFEGSRGETPVKDGITDIRIVLMRKTVTHILNAGSGGKASLTNGSEVQITANSLVDESGAPYTGAVNMSVRYLDPSKPEFGMLVPGGDMLAQRTDETTSMLYSYGILRVKLMGSNGEALQVAAGKTSTIIMDIPDKQLAAAPATIPLWYFNEEKAIWIEEGSALKQGDKYIGTVKHFTDWNCDVDEEVATIIGQLIDCNGNPAWGHVEFGQVGEDVGPTAETGKADGRFRQRVPANISLTVVVYDPLYLTPLLPGEQGKGKLIVIVPPLAPEQVYDVGKLQIFPCPSSVKVKFKLKAGDELNYLVFESPNGGTRYIENPGNDFSLSGFSSNQSMTVTVKTTAGITYFKSFQTAAAGGTVDLGEIDISNFQQAYVTGILLCGTTPLTSGQVTATWTNASGDKNESDSPQADGSFRIAVELNKTIVLTMTTEKGVINKTITTSGAAGSVINLGAINFCAGPQPKENGFTINGDGYTNATKLFNLKPYPQSTSIFMSSASVTYLSAFDITDTIRFTIYFSGKSVGPVVLDENTGIFIQITSGTKVVNYFAGFEVEGTTPQITITRYDAVSGLVEGNFKGDLISDQNKKVTITNGKFSVIRYPDL